MTLRFVLLLVVLGALACDGDDHDAPATAHEDTGGEGGVGGSEAGHSGSGANAGAGNAGASGMPPSDGGAGASGSGGSSDSGVSGTSGGGDASVSDSGMPDHEASFASLRALQCMLHRACCEDAGLSTSGLDDCEIELAQQSEWLTTATDNGAITIDAAALTACVAAASARFSGCTDLPRQWHSNDGLPPIAECNAVFVGTVAEGEPCTGHEVCAQGAIPSYCVPIDGHICLSIAPGVLGDSCVMTSGPGFRSYPIKPRSEGDVECRREDGLQCAGGAGVFECVAVKPTGEACTTEKECAADAYCDGTCQPRKAVGESCTLGTQCREHCSAATSTCTDHYVPSAIACETLGI